ncbi:P27 family phage terminase small subunit [Bradyrhizobium sp. UFLA05-153]
MEKPSKIAPFPAKAVPEPPPELGSVGSALWRTVMARYVIEDAHAEVLKLACLAADRAESARLEIVQTGQMVPGAAGQMVVNPLIAAEGAAQKRVAQFLTRLGLFDEAAKRDKPGRPPRQGY